MIDERLAHINELYGEQYETWDDMSREDLLYYVRMLLIEREMMKEEHERQFAG